MIDIPEGKTGTDRTTGQRVIRQNGQWVPLNAGGKPPVQEASMRGRMDLGLAPMMAANQQMRATESAGNPYNLKTNADNALAKLVGSVGVSVGQNQFYPLEAVAKSIGGQDYQTYEQAASAFESQLMPIMSGAAVSPSEARRQIRAALPALGDSEQTLAEKSRTREMMLNGAAKARGLPLPYPKVPTWGVNTMNLPQGTPPQKGGRQQVQQPQTQGQGWKVLSVE